MKFMAYHWDPNEIYGVQSKSPTRAGRPPPAGEIDNPNPPTPDPGPPPAGKIDNPNPPTPDPGPPPAEKIDNPNPLMLLLTAVVVVVATRESRLYRQ